MGTAQHDDELSDLLEPTREPSLPQRRPPAVGAPAVPQTPTPAPAKDPLVATPTTADPEAPDDPAGSDQRRRYATVLHTLNGQTGVALVAILAGCLAWWFSSRHSLPLIYADARSHLTISRRLLDGPNHSLVQLGTVWLPLPHLVIAPFTLVTAWWRSGFSVVPVNIVCLVIEAIALYRVVYLACRSKLGGWIAVAVLLTNPGWLYLHTTSLGEPVLFAAILATAAGLSGWIRSEKPYSGGELTVFCGLPAAAAVLSRYDGWAMAFAAGVLVVIVAQQRWGQWRYTLRCLRGFAIAPLIAAAWWCWFNFINWGDPLEFQRGKYSAQAQQDLLDRAGLLPDKGDIGQSLHTYATATLEGSGRWVLVAAALGAVAWLLTAKLQPRAWVPWLLVGVPAGFYALSLYTGQIALRLGEVPGTSMFNLRYGLQVLPGLAAMVGIGGGLLAGARSGVAAGRDEDTGHTTAGSHSVAAWRRPLAACCALAVLVVTASGWIGDWRSVPVVAEGLQQRELGAAAWNAAEYLHRRAVDDDPDGGLIMIDDSINPMLPVIGADLNRVSAPFSGPRWTSTLQHLDEAEWLFADTSNGGDSVARAIDQDSEFDDEFDLAFSDGTISVFHRGDSPRATTR